jgi:low affinity Fe/Cu permease
VGRRLSSRQRSVQLKLDELIRATAGAHNGLLDLEELGELELAAMHARFLALAARARSGITSGTSDTGTDEL